jgi:hypothetical protein
MKIWYPFLLVIFACNEEARPVPEKLLETSLQLPPCEKLVTLGWEAHSFWYATRPFREGEKAEVTTLRNQAPYSTIEEIIVITESCNK